MPIIGFLLEGTGLPPPAFYAGLKEFGLVEGQNITIEYRRGETYYSHTKIKTALLRLAATEDDSQFLHPEHLVHCLDERDTREWQLRLERLPWMHRVADRNMLLDGLQT